MAQDPTVSRQRYYISTGVLSLAGPTAQYIQHLLEKGGFSCHWKAVRFALTSKGKRDPELSFAYPLLRILDTTGKMFQALTQTTRAGWNYSPRPSIP